MALFGSDTAHEVGGNIPGFNETVIHKFAVVARGMNLFDNLDLEEAAETAARLDRWEFLFMAGPVRVPQGDRVADQPDRRILSALRLR